MHILMHIYIYEFNPFHHSKVAYYILNKNSHLSMVNICLCFQVRNEYTALGLSV